jgi:sulfate permease, SulP family
MKAWKRTSRMLRRLSGYFAHDHVRPATFVGPVKRYGWLKLRADMRAALAVTMLGIPQSIAYASIAGVPILSGILCGAMASMVGPLFCGSRHIILGPTNATALLLFSFFVSRPDLSERSADLVPLLVTMVGLLAVAGALLKVADLLQYVSRSVLVGYMSGAACLIIANQLKHCLGVMGEVGGATTFVEIIGNLLKGLPKTDAVSACIAGATFGMYFGLRKWRPCWPAFALTLVAVCSVFWCLARFQVGRFSEVATFGTFVWADFRIRVPSLAGGSFFSDFSDLLPVAFAIAFLACLESSLMAKTLASRSADKTDSNQDMFGLGLSNLACSLVGAMPASGSMVRSALNFDSGAMTRFASLYSGLGSLLFALGIAGLAAMGVPVLNFLPKAALAALVISISFSLFNMRHLRICLRSTTDDAGVLVTTFAATLLAPLHVAIFIGVAVSIALFLRKASRPHLVEYEFNDAGELRQKGEKRARPIPAISIVHVEGDLFFGAADLFRTQIQRTVADPSIRVIILRLKNARHLDATSVMALEELVQYVRQCGLHLIVSGASRDVYRVLKQSGVLETLQNCCDRKAGESNVFLASPRNPNWSTRNALKRAQQLLGTKEAEIRIFHDPSHSTAHP